MSQTTPAASAGSQPRPIDHVFAEMARADAARQRGPQETATARTVAALNIEPADAAEVELALSLSRTIDRMDEPTRAKMHALTAGQLRQVLDRLAKRTVTARRVAASRRSF